jgi:hypothetical protein
VVPEEKKKKNVGNSMWCESKSKKTSVFLPPLELRDMNQPKEVTIPWDMNWANEVTAPWDMSEVTV